eukprot:scaffold13606_cov100-Cyclotella_meneghiniana.AAC.3
MKANTTIEMKLDQHKFVLIAIHSTTPSIAVDESITDAGIIVCQDDKGPGVHTSNVSGPTRITDVDAPIPVSQSHYATKAEHKETKPDKPALVLLNEFDHPVPPQYIHVDDAVLQKQTPSISFDTPAIIDDHGSSFPTSANIYAREAFPPLHEDVTMDPEQPQMRMEQETTKNNDIIIPEAYLVTNEMISADDIPSAEIVQIEKCSVTIAGRKIHIALLGLAVLILISITAGVSIHATAPTKTSAYTGMNSEVALNASEVSLNASEVALNASEVALNASEVASNASEVASNASEVASNASEVASNASEEASNASEVASNASEVASNASEVTSNASEITSNASEVASDASAFASEVEVALNASEVAIQVDVKAITNELEMHVLTGNKSFYEYPDFDTRNLALNWIINDDPMKLGASDSNLRQRYALALLGFELKLSRSGWLSEGSECFWIGVSCRNGKVNEITFDAFQGNLSGTLPPEIGSLHSLTYLDLSWISRTGSLPINSSNSLTGSLPTEIGSLRSLTYLDLGLNSLTGTLPTEIGSLHSLTHLDLRTNPLTDSLPTEIGSLRSLVSLNLGWNSLNGTLPTEIGSLRSLTSLDLGWNFLTGSLPTEIGSLRNLKSLDLKGNELTGRLPTEIGDLILANLTLLDIRSNAFTGVFPESISNAIQISDWDDASFCFSGNFFTAKFSDDSGNSFTAKFYEDFGYCKFLPFP